MTDTADDEALVESAFRAGREIFSSRVKPDETYVLSEVDRIFMRAAIAVIRPTIEAAERERCAKIADDIAAYAKIAQEEASKIGNKFAAGLSRAEKLAVRSVARAIRGKTHD